MYEVRFKDLLQDEHDAALQASLQPGYALMPASVRPAQSVCMREAASWPWLSHELPPCSACAWQEAELHSAPSYDRT